MKKISVKKALAILISIAVFGVVIIFISANKNKNKIIYTTLEVEKTNLVQTVSETGEIKTSEAYDLGFQQGGNISNILVNVGDVVQKNQILAELDHSNLDIQLNNAKASLAIARANLNKLQSGATAQDIAVYQANYNRAKSAYDSALVELDKYNKTLIENTAQAQKTVDDLQNDDIDSITSYEQAIITAQTNLDNTKTTYQKNIDDAISNSLSIAEAQSSLVNNALDQINTILTDTDIEDYFSVKNKSYSHNAEISYNQSQVLLTEMNELISLSKNDSTQNTILDLLISSLNTLNKTFYSLNNTFTALENSITSSDFSQTELDSKKAIVNTQIGIISAGITSTQTAKQGLESAVLAYATNVDAAQNNLSQAQSNYDNALTVAKNSLANIINGGEQQLASLNSKINSAKDALLVSQAELNKIKAPARVEDLRLRQAQLEQAQSGLESIQNQIERMILKSKTSGTVSKINYEIGEQYMLGKPIISIISGKQFQVEVFISESDIPKVKLGNKVSVTLDALGSDIVFDGVVSFIEPAQTVIQDVIYYKVEILLNNENKNISLIKYGMTANIEINTNNKINIIAIPGRAIIDKGDEGKFVKTYNNEKVEEKKVSVGIIGDGGMVEILSGLSVSDQVVTFSKEK